MCLFLAINAQQSPTKLVDEYGKEYFYDNELKAKIYELDGERIVIMDEMTLMKKPKFNNQLDRNFYYFINKRLLKVYPLFLTALEEYRTLQKETIDMKSNEKRRYIKEKQNELAKDYETKLRDLTTSEGRIFAKLMSRATGKSVYEIIKELRGGWNAFIWNIKGNVADIDLKQGYDPYRDRHDEYLESLLISNWQLGYIKPYQGYDNFVIVRNKK